jgi:hypothetical protein
MFTLPGHVSAYASHGPVPCDSPDVSGSHGSPLAPWGGVLLGVWSLALSLVVGSRSYFEAVERSRRSSRLFPFQGSRESHRRVNRILSYALMALGAALIVWGLAGLL